VEIVGLMWVRNEADILRTNLLHHLAQGIDRFLVVDNGSTDGTDRVLRELAGDGRVRWTRDEGPYRQGEITTELAREAFGGGADWVLPIDADEFWYAPRGGLRHVLAASAAGALGARVVNFVQRRDQLERSPTALLHMTRRHVPIAVGDVEELVEGRHIAFVEMGWGVKWISRPTASIEIASGNQRVRGVAGRPADWESAEIVCLHAPLRARAVLETRMVDFGQRAQELERPRDPSESTPTWRRLALDLEWAIARNPLRSSLRLRRLQEEYGLDQALAREWAANSYADDCLDVYGVRHPVVYDPRLRDLVAPWVEQ